MKVVSVVMLIDLLVLEPRLFFRVFIVCIWPALAPFAQPLR